jgi:hypothetical protein
MASSSQVAYLYTRIRDKEVATEGQFWLGSIPDVVKKALRANNID